MPINALFGRWRQEDQAFKDSLGEGVSRRPVSSAQNQSHASVAVGNCLGKLYFSQGAVGCFWQWGKFHVAD